MYGSITHSKDPEVGLPELIRTDQEKRLNNADWLHAWNIRRKAGLTPDQKSWLFLWSNGLLINNVKLLKLGKATTDKCDFCDEQDSRLHMLYCNHSKTINEGIFKIINSCSDQNVCDADTEILNLNIPTSLQLPAIFIFCEALQQVHECRLKKQPVQTSKLIATIKVKSEAFLLSKKLAFAHQVVSMWLDAFFSGHPDATLRQPPPAPTGHGRPRASPPQPS